MIEAAYVKNGCLLKAMVNGHEVNVVGLTPSKGDRFESFSSVGVTYVKGGFRYFWSENGSRKTICRV